jgi:hypothetical protein
VKGFDKKLMSDRHLPVSGKNSYRLALKYRSKDNVIIHVGLACFDEHRVLISPVQVVRLIGRFVGSKTQQ